MSSLLLLVNCYSVPGCRSTAVSVISTSQVHCCRASQMLFHLMLQEHANSLCWSNAVSVITASQLPSRLLLQVNCCFGCHCWSTAVSVATAGQLLSKLLMHVQLLSKLLQVKLLLKVNLCLTYCSRSPSCVRVTSTGLVLCQLFLRANHCFCYTISEGPP
jgi:hypothetical protein